MPITFKRAGQEAVTLENLSFGGIVLDKVTFKRAGQESITVFESKPQLSVPQNVTADGTVVSWDEVENATEYEVYADGTSIGTVQAQSSETWVLNETLSNPSANITVNINFTSNNTQYNNISINEMPAWRFNGVVYDIDGVYIGNGGWANEAYRTITFDTAPTGDLLSWLQANGVKQ